jgi:two-component system OmpR family response regulator
MENIKVLIVDDEPDISFFLSRALQKNNYDAAIAKDLKTAEMLIESILPSIVLLDNHLPDGYGIDFTAKIKFKYPALKIVMITAHDSPQDRLKAIKNGVDFFIAKPFEIEKIISLVKEIYYKPLKNVQ